MNYFTILALLFITISCATIDNHQDTRTDNLIIDQAQITQEPYNINLKIDKTDAEDEYNLIVSMELNNESYFGSPFSNNDFTGLFNISIEDNEYIITRDTLIETPRSVETMDFRENVPVNWVSVNTTYQQHFKVVTKDDFTINGLIRFVIEPRCTLEKIQFVVSYQSGTMTVKQLG